MKDKQGEERKEKMLYVIEDDISLDECMGRCSSNSACKGIEYWSGLEIMAYSHRSRCLECLDPESTVSFTNESFQSFPPSVFKRGILRSIH